MMYLGEVLGVIGFTLMAVSGNCKLLIPGCIFGALWCIALAYQKKITEQVKEEKR